MSNCYYCWNFSFYDTNTSCSRSAQQHI